MVLRKKDGIYYSETKPQRDIVPVRLNEKEREILESSKQILEQAKDSTAIKQLMIIGSIVIHEEKIIKILKLIFDNKRKNKRLGIVEFE